MFIFIFITCLFLITLGLELWFVLDKDENWPMGAVLSFILFAICVGVGYLSHYTESERNVYNTTHYIARRFSELNREYESLLGLNPDKEKVNAYNEKANSFKQEIIDAQERLKNPWINWYTCSVYNSYDAEEVKIITVTIYTANPNND